MRDDVGSSAQVELGHAIQALYEGGYICGIIIHMGGDAQHFAPDRNRDPLPHQLPRYQVRIEVSRQAQTDHVS